MKKPDPCCYGLWGSEWYRRSTSAGPRTLAGFWLGRSSRVMVCPTVGQMDAPFLDRGPAEGRAWATSSLTWAKFR